MEGEEQTKSILTSSIAVKLSAMRKMPEVPEMGEAELPVRRGDPFALSDWGRGSVANTTKP